MKYAHKKTEGLFLIKDLFLYFSGGAYIREGFYMDKNLRFKKASEFQGISFRYSVQNRSHTVVSLQYNFMFKFNKPQGLFSEGGGLYMEGVFRFKNLFHNAPGLMFGGAYFRDFTVC